MLELAPWVKWVESVYWRLLSLVEEVKDGRLLILHVLKADSELRGQLLILHVLRADSLPWCQTYMRRIPQEYVRRPGEHEALSAGEIGHSHICHVDRAPGGKWGNGGYERTRGSTWEEYGSLSSQDQDCSRFCIPPGVWT